MNARIICFASSKGGSGKTVICASLSKFLAGIGKSVLLIDADAPTNGLTLFYLDEVTREKKRRTDNKIPLHGIFEEPPTEPLIPFKLADRISLVPATFILSQTRLPADRFAQTLVKAITSFRLSFDYILVDGQAGSDVYAELAMRMADDVILVSEYDPISAEGVERLKRLFPQVLTYQKTWILYNKILPEFSKSVGDYLSISRYLNPIPWDADVVRSYARRKLAIDMDHGNPFTIAIMRTVLSLDDQLKEAVDKWRENKADAIKQPLKERLDQLNKQMGLAQEQKIDLEYRLKNLKLRSRRFLTYYLFVALGSLSILTGYATVIGFIFYSQFLAATFTVLLFGAVVIYALNQLYSSRTQRNEKRLISEISTLELTLEHLEQEYNEYTILVESSIERLIENKKL